jgi:hypothetical protein
MRTLLDEFKTITEALNENGVDYAVCGGWAMAIHGLPRATMDIDLLVRAEDAQRIFSIVERYGFDIRGLTLPFEIEIQRVSKIDPELKQLITLDLLIVGENVEDIWESRHMKDWEEGVACVVSSDGLMKMKMMAGRTQDLADIEKLMELSDES